MNHDTLRQLAIDLRQAPPRSPRETLAGYVLAARIVDKCRALVLGQNGDYTYGTGLDLQFFQFAGLKPEELKQVVATEASDADIERWIRSSAVTHTRVEIVKWNNWLRDLRMSELPDELQERMEDYIREHCPKHRPIYHYLDIYDLEEGRL